MKLALCWVTMALAQVGHAADLQTTRKTLAGITTVQILVEGLDPAAGSIGLTKESLRADVEVQLRTSGMQIVGESSTFVYVNIALTTDARSANILVELYQPVTLLRNPTITSSAVTWSVGGVIANPSARGIHDMLKDMIDEFIGAWSSVNRAKGSMS